MKKIRDVLRVSYPITFLYGREFLSSHNLIEIDVTYACNLKCINCNRSCSQAPDESHMKLSQIEKFIDETMNSDHSWNRIRVLGGEPFLHPEIDYILEKLVEFKKRHSNSTRIEISTNGFGEKIKEAIGKVPPEVAVINTYKKSRFQEIFEPFNLAPCDLWFHTLTDYLNACWVTSECGIGLNKFGYYQCAVAAGIDRVMGFDVGLKSLLSVEEGLMKQKRILCRFCGHFLNRVHIRTRMRKKLSEEIISKSWREGYERFRETPPILSIY